jgi:Tol biopolymer transport system component
MRWNVENLFGVGDADGGEPRPHGRRCPRKEIALELCGGRGAAAWSPGGSRIAGCDFVLDSAAYVHQHLFSPSSARTAPAAKKSPHFPAVDTASSGRPDGSRLAFWSGDLDRPGQIFVINADGSGLRRVTREGDNRWPAGSPDGSRIAFVHSGTISTLSTDGYITKSSSTTARVSQVSAAGFNRLARSPRGLGRVAIT